MRTELGYNVDALSTVQGGTLVAGLSNFVGREWTGGVAVISTNAGGGLQTQAMLPVRAGVPSVACLPLADDFTGRRVVASGADDGSVDLWYLALSSGRGSGSGVELQHAQARVMHDAAVLSLACPSAAAAADEASSSGGSHRLASASADGTLRLWDCVQLLACTAQLGRAGGPGMNAVAWTAEPDVVASASSDGQLCLWDSRQLSSYPAAATALGAPVLCVAAAAGGAGQLLVAGDQLGRVSVLDVRNCSQPLQQRRLHRDAVHALAAASSGSSGSSLLASGSDDGSIMLLDSGKLEASRQLAPAKQDGEAPCYVRALAWAGSGSSGGGGGGAGVQQLFRGGWDQAVEQVAL